MAVTALRYKASAGSAVRRFIALQVEVGAGAPLLQIDQPWPYGRVAVMRTLAVRFAAMANGNDINEFFQIDNSIHNAPLADPDAPQIACSFGLFRSGGARAARERFNALEDAQRNRGSSD